ncbi:hypothetical protein C7447_101729 [Tenacibaculum adriaticum]|uniref:IstB-like ATP binding protein n=1 Tax=Tenacibaculum adriaticum TaxID=413713 RepID=A0A5S5E031_9FLAO|nr:ATP-binding protein [Tenacibaculum adriaticum]TYQ00120.1 hypothetical protein C7447_101729 [Tenacibaculum adriaticum]
MSVITYREVFGQLKADLIGKDSYRGITLTYAWLANQFGHIALGFIPSFLLNHFLIATSIFKNPLLTSSIVTFFWFLFEFYNFLGPLLLKKISISGTMYIPQKSTYVFTPSWKNIALDTFTDLCFFALGAFSFAYIKTQSGTSILILTILLIYLSVASRYWFLTKMYQFYANYPFQFRLSQWDFCIDEIDKPKIENFLNNNDAGKHLLIFGSQLSGKTSLGVGLLNELSIKHKSCLYTSAIKLYTYFFVEDNLLINKRKLWTWKESKYLIIDDVNPGNPIKEELVCPDKFLKFLDPTEIGKVNEENCEILSQKNIIWILGNYKEENLEENNWVKMLLQIGVNRKKIDIINLT